MVRRDNPRDGATHLTVSNSWINPTNRVYKLRSLSPFWEDCFTVHLARGGEVFRFALRVPTTSLDDVALLKAERKAWAAIKKRFQRWESPALRESPTPGNPFGMANHRTDLLVDDNEDLVLGDGGRPSAASRTWDWTRPAVLYRWLSVVTSEGAYRVIYSSAPAYDGHEREADPCDSLLTDMRDMRPLGGRKPKADRPVHSLLKDADVSLPGDPYPRRAAHGGPDDAWNPPKRATGEWKTVGRRSARAFLDEGQDMHDELACVANDVKTWRATKEEMAARNPEGILQTRHFRARPEQPRDHLLTLFESIGFDLFPGAREWALNEEVVEVPVKETDGDYRGRAAGLGGPTTLQGGLVMVQPKLGDIKIRDGRTYMLRRCSPCRVNKWFLVCQTVADTNDVEHCVVLDYEPGAAPAELRRSEGE